LKQKEEIIFIQCSAISASHCALCIYDIGHQRVKEFKQIELTKTIFLQSATRKEKTGKEE
jgi:hypothetical protein